MRSTAIVDNHIAGPEEQALHIDAGGEDGKLASPVLAPTDLTVRNARDSVAFVLCAHWRRLVYRRY